MMRCAFSSGILGIALVPVAACSGGETLVGEADTPVEDAAVLEVPDDSNAGDEADAPSDANDATTDTEEVGPVCGNGEVEGEEECDEADDNSDEPDAACRSDCRLPGCGDGVADSGEECDLLDLRGLSCASVGFVGGMLRCGTLCRLDRRGCRDPDCGNGICDVAESATACPADCDDACGDRSCADTEDQIACPADCGAVSVSVGATEACAVIADGSVRCWNLPASTPTVVVGLPPATSVAVSWSHACAGLANGTAMCWGSNVSGELGNGTTSDEGSAVPVPVSGLTTVSSVAVSQEWSLYSYAVLCNGRLAWWGSGALVPRDSGLADVVSVDGGGGHDCAVLSDGTVRCWGSNLAGELGDGSFDDPRPIDSGPLPVLGLTDAFGVSAGGQQTCAVVVGGDVWCWGRFLARTPQRQDALAGAVSVSMGRESCANFPDGTVRCWDDEFVIAPLGGWTDVTAVSGGGFSRKVSPPIGVITEMYGCVVRLDGTVWCWDAHREPVIVPAW